jgi:hypothetical protein
MIPKRKDTKYKAVKIDFSHVPLRSCDFAFEHPGTKRRGAKTLKVQSLSHAIVDLPFLKTAILACTVQPHLRRE